MGHVSGPRFANPFAFPLPTTGLQARCAQPSGAQPSAAQPSAAMLSQGRSHAGRVRHGRGTGRLLRPSAVLVALMLLGASIRPSLTLAETPHPAAAQKPVATVDTALAGLSPEIQRGEIEQTTLPHPKTDVQWGHAVGIVEAPLSDVMRIVSDYGSYQEFMPHFEKSRVLSQRGARALVYMEALIAKGTMTVWAQLKIRPSTHDDPNTRVVLASMTKGNLSHMEARWEIRPLDARRTLVTFDMLVDPKIPLPAGLVSTENRKAARRSIKALRKRLTQQ